MAVNVVIKGVNGKINENVYGQFIEEVLDCIHGGIYAPDNILSDEEGIRSDVVEKVKELKPPVLRFPGGTVMCQYHWEDAIGSREQRIRRKNLIWGGEIDPSFGTAEFVMFCRKIGAEPMICVNMASGSPEEAGNWVEYCNGTGNSYYANLRRSHGYEQPFNVKYWCIGNESYAEPDIGIHHDVLFYIRDAWEFIKVMKLTDDSIKTIVVGCEKIEWNKQVLDSLQSVTDYFSIHHYSGESNKGIYGPFEGEKHLTDLLKEVSALIDTYPEQVKDFNPWYRFSPRQNKIQIALDEWNIWDFKEDETYGLHQIYCWRDALWVASVLNLLLRTPSVGMANMAQMVNVIAPIVAEETGSWFQTIGYPLKLYRKLMRGERMDLEFKSPVLDVSDVGEIELLSISAVNAENGTIYLAVVNRDMEKECVICLSDEKKKEREYVLKELSMISLTAESPRAVCSLKECCVKERMKKVSAEEIILEPGSINIITIE